MIGITLEGDLKLFPRWHWYEFSKRVTGETMPRVLEGLRAEAPVKTGRLKNSLYGVTDIEAASFVMTFADTEPYFPWVVFEGTAPHDIPGAFGRPAPFGVGGRFGGLFHPGITHPDDFPSRVWATMEIAFRATVVATLRQEIL